MFKRSTQGEGPYSFYPGGKKSRPHKGWDADKRIKAVEKNDHASKRKFLNTHDFDFTTQRKRDRDRKRGANKVSVENSRKFSFFNTTPFGGGGGFCLGGVLLGFGLFWGCVGFGCGGGVLWELGR